MKKILFTNIAFVLILTGCGEDKKSAEQIVADGDMNAIRSMKKELSVQQRAIANEIAVLDEAIEKGSKNANLPLVTTFETELKKFVHYIELQGGVATKKNVLVYPEAAGILRSVYVTDGQRVKKGEILAIIDDGGLSSQLLQLKTQLELAETTYERQKRLWDQNIGTEIQFLQAKSNYEAQQKAIDRLKAQLDKFKIRAPFTGIVDDVILDQGTVVGPGVGSEVFRVINLNEMYIEVPVPETYVSSIKVGTQVEAYFPVLDKTIDSKVRQTGNFINPNNRSFTVEVPVANRDKLIKPNMTAKVKINDYINPESILIPQSIISENSAGQQYVFAVSSVDKQGIGQAKKQIITTGKTQGSVVEVLTGISDGVSLIEEGARNVKEGQNVKILTK